MERTKKELTTVFTDVNSYPARNFGSQSTLSQLTPPSLTPVGNCALELWHIGELVLNGCHTRLAVKFTKPVLGSTNGSIVLFRSKSKFSLARETSPVCMKCS